MSALVVVPTGTANLASVCAAFRRLGSEARVSHEPDEVARAARVVLPGVGAFGAAMAELRRSGLDVVLRERIAAGRPTLAICLGLQLLAERSEESPGVAGLGVVGGEVGRLSPGVRVPQLGWNRVRPDSGDRSVPASLIVPGWAFFAHSYRLVAAPAGWSVAWTDHGGPVVAAIARGPVLGCQFHPELSGAWGERLLGRWLEGTW